MRLYGKNSVIERLRANPRTIRKVFIEPNHPEGNYIKQKAKKWGIPVFTILRGKMVKIARNINTQGILVETDDFIYLAFSDLLQASIEQKRTLIFLDSLNDPQNLGAIIRSLACLGKFSIIIPTHDSVEVTEAALRIASGGENYVLVSKVSNLTKAIREAKENGFFIAGAVVEEGERLTDVRLQFPLALVVGSEQKGIRGAVQKDLDVKVTIPMAQQGLSLNVAHATAVFAYDIQRQRIKNRGMARIDAESDKTVMNGEGTYCSFD